MRLKSLEIQGFKSFPDRTKLDFVNGITAVVGPNGMGKSNISDAIRWVLGEQSTKTLRGAKMEDVIFMGTLKRKALGYAEVSLTFDNSAHELDIENDEVTITRKYYRSGESDYQINRQNVRLKDVNELFMDTGLGRDGYSMIGQGKIDEIVSVKSNERREVFEEAAGISKYRYRKTEAEHRLDLAADNLLRLNDIMTELESRVEPLRIQSEKAVKFLEYSKEKKQLEISLWVNNLEESKNKLRDHEYKLTAARESYDKLCEELDSFESELEKIHKSGVEFTLESEQLREQKNAIEDKTANTRSAIAVLENDILHNSQRIDEIKDEINGLGDSTEKVRQTVDEENNKIVGYHTEADMLRKELLDVQDKLVSLQGKNDSISADIEGQNAHLSGLVLEITKNKVAVSGLMTSSQETDLQSKKLALQLKELESQRKDLNRQRAKVNSTLSEFCDALDKLSNMRKGYDLKLSSAQSRKKELEEQHNDFLRKLSAKEQKLKLLGELEKNMDGFYGSVKNVMTESRRGALRGICGTVAQLIRVPKRYSVAVETALGGVLQNIIVENESNAKAAISFLKNNSLGRATFLPITTVKGKVITDKGLDETEGFIGIASELTEYDDKYRDIVKSVLGRICICDTLDSATALARRFSYKFRIVTLDGQLINAGGSFTGGSASKSTGVLTRRYEIEALTQEIEKIKRDDIGITEKLREVSAQYADAEGHISGIAAEQANANEDKIRAEGELNKIKFALSENDERMTRTDALITENEKKKKNILAEIERLSAETVTAETEKSETESKLLSVTGDRAAAVNEINRVTEEVTKKRFRIVELEKDIDSVSQNIVHLTERLTSDSSRGEMLNAELQRLSENEKSIREQIESYSSDIEADREKSEQIVLQIESLQKKKQDIEREIELLRQREKDRLSQREQLSNEVSRIEERKINAQTEYDELVFKLQSEYELSKNAAYEIATKLENPAAANKRVGELKNKIKSLGSINTDAIEEYKEVSERYAFMKAQISDAESSRNKLIKLIDELTGQMKTIFSESFVRINDNFTRIFSELFGGGKAHLELSDPENILESGIEIYAQPPGKIVKSLAALSGGERAFIAIAIYIAILKVKPAPFCVLDEIEAALDDVNVIKYAQYLRRMCDKTQFILITHRRGSMEEADVLYGVTMQEKGVSKLIELKLSEVESKLGITEEQ